AVGAPDALAAPVTVLVAFLGWIIGDYAHRYLRGEPGQRRFVTAYLATLAAVGAVIASDHLALLVGAWAASSVGLHQLLTFYRERPAAVVVAHKKFLASRLAEACLVAAMVLLVREWGSLDLAVLGARAAGAPQLPWSAGAAAALIAVAALLKCAQLPLHGWLIQVMEAPTPVSALLHAGVVNLGGYVLIRLAPLISASPVAEALLVVVGTTTAAAAGLVMLTRVTVKVRLAWSTCSQMGLMVTECGLGLYDLALLHLLAHALYKAHAFLTAGEAVLAAGERDLLDSSDGATRAPTAWTQTQALGLTLLLVAGSAALWHRWLGAPALPWLSGALLSCGLATLLWWPLARRRHGGRALIALVAAAQLYLGWHWLLSTSIPVGAPAAPGPLAAWSLLVFLALYYAQLPAGGRVPAALAGRAYDWVYAGFYLDERFTRLAFRLWPVRTPPLASRPPPAGRSSRTRSPA
ncbi:MAG: NADH-quinone oxidoreductase subunit L, partial [Proteobacteria bacterium]|nr:NADH-quinone oxidoreductase subunit L [Pseudomonadota bacterium]